ncbi:LCCL domain-containing protein, partial [Hepatocystis sp. ex Piliocolobus tephrosceles]
NVVQNIIFNHVIRAKSLKISMRYAIHEYFGINFTNVLGSKDPTLRIQSGMTSLTQDLCLQVNETNEVVLDGCITAMSYLDGRDLWKLNAKNQVYNPISNLCMTLKNNLTANGGEIIMEDCNASLEHNDGRSNWQLLPNNQLKLLRDGNFCLSQDGTKSGSTDVAMKKQATSTLSRQNKNYSPGKAIDGNIDTFWLSQTFTLDTAADSVFFEINLGAKYKLQKCIIDWVYPATKYVIMLSADGENYFEVSSNLANFLRNTINNLHNKEAQYIKLQLMAPNPEFAIQEDYIHPSNKTTELNTEIYNDNNKEGSNLLCYGIKKISVYSNRIKTIVDDCDTIKDSDDARDKYFFEFVSEVNLQEGKELKKLDGELQQYAEKIQNEALNIQKLNSQLKKCKAEKEKKYSDIMNIKNVILRNIYDVINETENIIKSNTISMLIDTTSTNELGHTPEYPADSCIHLKSIFPNISSGFYYVLTPCAQNVLRVYCDMKLGSMYYIPPIDAILINKLKDVENICATYGLNPIHLHHESQIQSIKWLLHLMNIKKTVPLAIRNKTEDFFSLDMQENVQSIISKFGNPINNTFGINNEGITFFDSTNTEMGAFVCSDNLDSINLPEPFVNLNCQSTLKDAIEIEKILGYEYLIRCPSNCLEKGIEATVIGGGEGNIYSENSAICLSAIHAGVYDKHYLIYLRVVNALNEYEGIFQNGIISESFINGTDNSGNNQEQLGFKIFNVPPKCPNDKPGFNFVFVEMMDNIDTLYSKENIYMDVSTSNAINDLVTIVNKQVSSTDPTFLGLINKQVIKIVSNARRYLKPTEKYEKNIELLSNETLKDVQNVSHKIKVLSSKITSELNKRKYKLESLITERLRQTEFESWALTSVTDTIYDTFEIINVIELQKSKWELIDKPLNDGMVGKTLTQNVRIYYPYGENAIFNLFNGTYAFLRYKLFYDFIFSTHINVKGTGSVGLLFRVYDKYNYYMLELNNGSINNPNNNNNNNGFKRLLKVQNNEINELIIINENGFDQSTWFSIRIECIGTTIKINIIKTNKIIYNLPPPDIVINDDFQSAGTIGFYTYGISNVEFNKPMVESLECISKVRKQKQQISPLSCNIYQEFYVNKFFKSYDVYDPEGAIDGPSYWDFMNNIGNENHVIAQKSNIKGNETDKIPSLIILRNKICHNGILNFSIYPQCGNGDNSKNSNGIIGAVIKFSDINNYTLLEIGSTFTRIRQNVNGVFHLLAKSVISGYKENIWNKVTITFNNTSINVNTHDGLMTYPVFSLIGLNLKEGYQLGFTSYNCNMVAFSNILIHPFDFKPYSPFPSTISEEYMIPTFTKISEKHIKMRNDFNNTFKNDIYSDQTKADYTNSNEYDLSINNNKIKKDIYYCATHKDIVDRLTYCNKYDKDNPNCVKEFCKICCDNIETTNEENKNSCIHLCQHLDEHITKTSELLDYLNKTCKENSNNEFVESCKNDNNKDECLVEMCQMCCQSITIPKHLLTPNMNINSLINHCITMCE